MAKRKRKGVDKKAPQGVDAVVGQIEKPVSYTHLTLPTN